ncbi:MAG: type II toxin-antitoxin system YafQ family toxin [Pyramidobacter sp.]|nr:type II toxin-antitoxin system YafQ family toxin [Pyramidobacter sp.]
MLKVRFSASFKKDYRRIQRRGYDMNLLDTAVLLLMRDSTLPPQYRDHQLTGNYRSFRKCHITPDWLLIYAIEKEELILCLSRTGTHSDLFKL